MSNGSISYVMYLFDMTVSFEIMIMIKCRVQQVTQNYGVGRAYTSVAYLVQTMIYTVGVVPENSRLLSRVSEMPSLVALLWL